jgi:hypothetical protein
MTNSNVTGYTNSTNDISNSNETTHSANAAKLTLRRTTILHLNVRTGLRTGPATCTGGNVSTMPPPSGA